jgi:2-polyprenyl-3-methyl-5-hydroxy-6-metoxy-1,4-benzoquinol methylase
VRAGLLPASLAGLRVLELGAGIGRFTGMLAQHGAAHVHAVDFMQNLIDEVRRRGAQAVQRRRWAARALPRAVGHCPSASGSQRIRRF